MKKIFYQLCLAVIFISAGSLITSFLGYTGAEYYKEQIIGGVIGLATFVYFKIQSELRKRGKRYHEYTLKQLGYQLCLAIIFISLSSIVTSILGYSGPEHKYEQTVGKTIGLGIYAVLKLAARFRRKIKNKKRY